MNASTSRWGWLLAGALLATMGCDDKSSESDDKAAEEDKKKDEKKKKKKDDEKANVDKAEGQCDTLGKACNKEEKYQQAIATKCKEPVKEQVKKGCTDEVVAVLKCFEKDVCSGEEAVQAYDDFRVLTNRHNKCGDEMKAVNTCMTGEK